MFLFFLVNNNETPSDTKYDFRGQPHGVLDEEEAIKCKAERADS